MPVNIEMIRWTRWESSVHALAEYFFTSKNQSTESRNVIIKDIGKFVRGWPPIIALIALKSAVNLLSPGALSNITPLTCNNTCFVRILMFQVLVVSRGA